MAAVWSWSRSPPSCRIGRPPQSCCACRGGRSCSSRKPLRIPATQATGLPQPPRPRSKSSESCPVKSVLRSTRAAGSSKRPFCLDQPEPPPLEGPGGDTRLRPGLPLRSVRHHPCQTSCASSHLTKRGASPAKATRFPSGSLTMNVRAPQGSVRRVWWNAMPAACNSRNKALVSISVTVADRASGSRERNWLSNTGPLTRRRFRRAPPRAT